MITTDSQASQWVPSSNLPVVAKPDQLTKRRGMADLLAPNKGWEEARHWQEKTSGVLSNFIVEPFLPHPSHTKFYIYATSPAMATLFSSSSRTKAVLKSAMSMPT